MQAIGGRPFAARLMAFRPHGAPLVVLAPAVLIGLAMLLPLVYLLIRGVGASGESWELLFRAQTAHTLGSTALLMALVTALSAVIAIPLAWLTVRTDLPLRRMWAVATVLPLVIPSYVAGYLVASTLGPRGPLQQLLAPLGVERLPEIYGLPGATLTLAFLSYPYLLLTLRGSWNSLDPSGEDAARNLGHAPWSVLFRITLPQLRPAIASGSLLVALYSLSDFGAVSLLRHPTLTWVIYQQYESSFDRSIAAALSMVVVAFAMGILFLESATRGRGAYAKTGPGASRVRSVVHLRRWKWPAVLLCSGVVLISLAFPTVALAHWLVRGALAGEPLQFLTAAALRSALVSGLAGVAAAALSIPMAALIVRHPSPLSRLLERLSYVSYALPGVAVALALVFFAGRYAPSLYQTSALLVFAYVVLFFPASLGATRAAMQQVSPRLGEAARGLGHNSLQVMRRVTIPLTRSGVLMGGAIVFLVAMKELPATLILAPLGFQTLATSVWSASSEAFFARAAAGALTIIVVSILPMAYLISREGGHASWRSGN